jgi:pilus assembly protein Flp/PilA
MKFYMMKGRAMENLKKLVRSFWTNEDGATATEYAVMLALIIVACIATIGLLGDEVNNIFTTVKDELAGVQ